MTNTRTIGSLLILAAVTGTGCLGYDRLLFVTRTNVGIDLDTQPPTAEVSIARREGVIEPTFKDTANENESRTLPTLAAFGLSGSFLSPSIDSVFAGGPAATSVVVPSRNSPDQSEQIEDEPNDHLCIQEKPVKPAVYRWIARWFRTDDVTERPLYFATDTTFGLKAAWSGTTGAAPDTVKLGYNRKEFALAPVFITKTDEEECKYRVQVPAFLATLDNQTNLRNPFDSSTRHVQFFATGAAAKNYAKRDSVRDAIFKQISPEAAGRIDASISLNESSFKKVSAAFQAASDEGKDGIIGKGEKLGLVSWRAASSRTKREQFLQRLGERRRDVSPQNMLKMHELAEGVSE